MSSICLSSVSESAKPDLDSLLTSHYRRKAVWRASGKHTFRKEYRKRNIYRRTSKTDFCERYIPDIPFEQSIDVEKM